jgi:hypothetical protein
MLYKILTISILFCYLIGTYHGFAFIPFYFTICSFRSLLFFLRVCSCVPLHSFDYVYDYLMDANLSFIDW